MTIVTSVSRVIGNMVQQIPMNSIEVGLSVGLRQTRRKIHLSCSWISPPSSNDRDTGMGHRLSQILRGTTDQMFQTTEDVCSRCASPGHQHSDCKIKIKKYAVCGGPHSSDQECLKWRKECRVAKLRNVKQLSYKEALL
ncbi:putative RNA-directed DNA polymerase from mobile element jockey-like 58 [Homarus americanus]|uniref:Putative RNA-directed DNA polymerase from mobile element jockey-like 58 n=1 Tax=Homarus americanus TaxID=6706 RepID=A0A8J5MLI8_HOMAM|nr:putative RNA-directed DNA polymerase from mobile element jockey-like 58 [Homarus americanus]